MPVTSDDYTLYLLPGLPARVPFYAHIVAHIARAAHIARQIVTSFYQFFISPENTRLFPCFSVVVVVYY
jgi:hypothetical protein